MSAKSNDAPFRTATGLWTNFAGDQSCRPAKMSAPASAQELADVLGEATTARQKVRVAGGGHSFTDAVLTDGTLISLDRMNKVLDVDRSTGLVRVQAGIRLGELSAALLPHGLAMRNLGDIDVQSIAGATATATHGTGVLLPNLSASLQAVQLTLADGSIVECSTDADAETWRAARVSLGALGVVSEVTIQAVPSFSLEGVDTTVPVDMVLDNLDELVDGNDHFGFFTFPHSPLAMTKTWNRTDARPQPAGRASEWFHDEVLTNYAYWGACLVGRAQPRWIPSINRLCSRLSGTTHRIDSSHRIFTTPRRVPLTEMEYAVPRAVAAEAVRQVRAIGEKSGYEVPTPLEVRFVAPDDAYLSPATGRETCYIAVHQFVGLEWDGFFREVEELLLGYGGRPHWGKRHFRTATDLASRYPDWDRFAAVRDRLDPHRVFTNAYVAQVLDR